MSACFAAICRHVAIKIRWIMRLPVGRVVRSTNVQISLKPVASLMRAPGVQDDKIELQDSAFLQYCIG
jgi:hypothetical protein